MDEMKYKTVDQTDHCAKCGKTMPPQPMQALMTSIDWSTKPPSQIYWSLCQECEEMR